MNPMILTLMELHELETDTSSRSSQRKAREVRASLPADILRRLDHLVNNGRKPVALLSESNGCTGCHLKIPEGTALFIRMRPEQLHLCPNCGRFLHVIPQAVPAAATTARAPASRVRA